MRSGTLLVVLVVPVLLAGTGRPVAADDATVANCTVYKQYCGACHGPAGTGDGVAAGFFSPRPTDLTQLAKKSKGEFPFNRVMQLIDGRETERAHGDPAMPVWGETFRAEASWGIDRRAVVTGKLMMITDCVRSLQQK